ncbi:MAG: DUF1657 domain-containing protein [Clostridia bacterium]|nr:DUF1657 domain-containing protein [Clostridia bacterium]
MTVSSQVKETVATLKGIESTLKIYAVQTVDQEIKSVFSRVGGVIDGVVNDLEERVCVLEHEEPQYKGL